MLHARFKTPNRWKRYLTQVGRGAIDDVEYPKGPHIAPLLSKYMARTDISFVPMPEDAPDYLRALSLAPYEGRPKVATLRVLDESSREVVEVPDWILYGEDLAHLTADERAVLQRRGVNVDAFVSGLIRLPLSSTGQRKYKSLW